MLLDRFLSLNSLLKSKIGHETLGSMGLKISSTGLMFVSTVVLARTLGPADFGIYAYVYGLVSLLSIPSQFGLPALVVRETAQGMAQKEYSFVNGIWRWSGLMTGLISLAVLILAGGFILIFKEPLSGKRLETFIWGLALVPLIALGNLRGAALRGLGKIVVGQLPEFFIRPALFVFLLIGSICLGSVAFSPALAMEIYVVASALAFGAGVWFLGRATPMSVSQGVPHFKHRAWLLSALPLAFIGAMGLINQQASILLQGFFLTDAEIGLFRVATQVSALASFGLMAINTVVAPRFATLFAQGEINKIQQLATKSAQVILIFNLVITFGFALLGKTLLRLFFGSSFISAYIPMLILLGGQVINSGVGSVGVLLNMTNHEKVTAKTLAFSAILNIGLNLYLLPIYGIIGSAIANVVSLASWNIMLWLAVRDNLGINSSAFIVKIKE